MGEVYRARDTSLHRFVAIKVLPDSLARDPERIARLQREARTLASLNDPNIAAIFGFQDEGGRHALILELVEGPTLANRIARGPLPVAESLAIARQIAKALDAAHQQGIVHRDLKPANIKVRDDGTVKVLDFGLSKAFEAGSAPDGSATPTITSPAVLTDIGVIIGSAAYMSPEQAKGLAADKRADIWAFGCVLYEMLTGRRAFDGAGVTETLAGVLRGEPNWALLPADLPSATRTLLTRCLEKERGERVQDISTAKFVLAEQASLSSPSAGMAPVRPARTRQSTPAWIAAAALAGAVAGAATVVLLRPAEIPVGVATSRFELIPSRKDPFTTATGSVNVAISPDGTRIVYTAVRDGKWELVLRRLDRLESTPIAGTEGGFAPFFSPDGHEVGFISVGELRRVPVDGGSSVTIWRGDPTLDRAVWTDSGTIVYGQDFGLFRIAAAGGTPVKIAMPDPAGEVAGFNHPTVLPGGRVILYSAVLRNGRSRVEARPIDGGTASVVVDDGFGPQYLAPRRLIYAQGDRLMAIAFDPDTLKTSGSAVAIEESVFTRPEAGTSNLAIAANGTAVFVAGHNAGAFSRLAWVDRSGAHLSRVAEQPLQEPRNLRLSPDGRRVVLTTGPGARGDIWVYDIGRAAQPVKLTFHDHNTFAIWSKDGTQVAYMSVVAGGYRVLSIAADGSGTEPRVLANSQNPGVPLDWSADGSILLFQKTGLGILRPGQQSPSPWMNLPFAQFGARFSPDGRWVAITSLQSGAADVWIRPFPGPGAPIRVSSDGGFDPVWSRDGSELFFTNGPKMMASNVRPSGHTLLVDPPHMLFQGGFVFEPSDLVIRMYDVGLDGRFLMIEPAENLNASIVVAQHWDEELRGRLAFSAGR
jgi:serine/threonine-protein kinase